MSRPHRFRLAVPRVATGLAWALVLVALVLPVAALFVRSLRIEQVETRAGEVIRAVGPVRRTERAVMFSTQAAPGAQRIPVRVPLDDVVRGEDGAVSRTVWSLDHYRFAFGDPRIGPLLRNSTWIAAGGALLALLLGLPLAWLLVRTDLPGRWVWGTLALAPAILPPFFIALGGAREVQAVLIDLFGLKGALLQRWNSILVFGLVLYPLTVLLVAPALRAVPAGPWEAARLLGGRWRATRVVTWPAVFPAIVGAWVLAFVVALTDFAVPDLLGFMLPAGGSPGHVFSTEVLLQWKQEGNTGRAVATGAPLVIVTAALVLLALVALRRSPLAAAGTTLRTRARRRLGGAGKALALLGILALLAVSVGLPLGGIASWAGSGGETSATGTAGSAVAATSTSHLGDFAGALDRTPGSREDRDRWIKTALATGLLATLLAIPLARFALRGGRRRRLAVVLVGALPLAVPGLVLSVGTKLLWMDVGGEWVDRSVIRSVLVMTAKFLPFALVAVWLALRRVRAESEESAALLGVGPVGRALRIWGPQALPGLVASFLVVVVLSLRELEAVMLIDPRILPLRLYDKIHFSRLADEANLLFLCMGYLLVPASLLVAWLAWRRRHSD